MQGMDEFESAMRRVRAATDAASKEIVTTDAAMLTTAAQANFSGSHRRGEPHVGGAFPNIVSGDLRRSIRADPITRWADASYGTSVAPHMVYGRRVELGWQGSTPHAFFQPAVSTAVKQFPKTNADIFRHHMAGAVS